MTVATRKRQAGTDIGATDQSRSDGEQLVAKPRPVVTFIARRQNLRLVMKAKRPERSPVTGEVIGETSGLTVPFDVYIDPVRKEQLVASGVDEREAQAAARYGRFECPSEGTVILEAEQEADAAQVLEWLLRHRMNGNLLEGFWRVDPTAPQVTREEMDAIVQAATLHEVETLEEIIRQEEAGWQREDVLNVARGSIERINEVAERVRAQIEAEKAEEERQAAAKAKPAARNGSE